MQTIKIALVGCGRISNLHFKAYREIREAEVSLICDSNIDLVRKKAAEWGVPGYTDNFDDVLNNPEIDAVEILTPQKLHEDMVIRALRAGKHVAVQKPMSITLKSADRMIREAERSGRIFKVTENYVSYPPIVKARRLIDEGAIGEPINIRINLIAFGKGGWEIPDTAWEWRMQELLEDRGQETFDHGHHLWSTAWYLMGGFSEVSAWIDSFQDLVDAPDVIMWKHTEDKRYGTCAISYCSESSMDSDYYANDEWIDITGSRGIIRINRCTGKLIDGPVMSLYRNGEWIHYDDMPSDWQLGFTGAAGNFIRAVRGEEDPLPSARQGREILAMNLAIQKSSRNRRIVYIGEMDHPWPRLYALTENHKRVKSEKRRKRNLLKDLRGNDEKSDSGPGATELTMNLTERARADEMKGWNAQIGLVLQENGSEEEYFTINIENGTCRIENGNYPNKANLIITIPRGVWVAILTGRKKIQTAFIQGKFKMNGDIEYAFKLKSVFGL